MTNEVDATPQSARRDYGTRARDDPRVSATERRHSDLVFFCSAGFRGNVADLLDDEIAAGDLHQWHALWVNHQTVADTPGASWNRQRFSLRK